MRISLTEVVQRGSATVLFAAGLLALAWAMPVSVYALSPHVIAEVDTNSCAACHDAHSATSALLLRVAATGDAVSASCLACHDGTDSTASNVATGSSDSFALPSGHSLDDGNAGGAETRGCASCHEIHGSQTDARMIPSPTINGTQVSSAGNEQCVACHDSDDSWFDGTYPSIAAPVRDAIGYPVTGTWTGPEAYASPSNAHARIPETTQTVGLSGPVQREQGDCRYCHAAHRGRNAYDGLETTFTAPVPSTLASDQAQGAYATLCFDCHGGSLRSGFTTATVDIRRYVTAETTSAGHRIVTDGGVLPVGAPLPCFECHNPHGSKRGNASMLSDERGGSLSTSTDAGVRAFCFTCHTTSDTVAGWDSADATLTPVPPGAEVVGLPRDGALLRLSGTDGHAETDDESCYECHGDNYAAGGRNVHNPGDGYAEDLAIAAAGAVLPPSFLATSAVDASASLDATATQDATPGVEATAGPASESTSDVPSVPFWPSLPAEPTALLGTAGGWVAARRRT